MGRLNVLLKDLFKLSNYLNNKTTYQIEHKRPKNLKNKKKHVDNLRQLPLQGTPHFNITCKWHFHTRATPFQPPKSVTSTQIRWCDGCVEVRILVIIVCSGMFDATRSEILFYYLFIMTKLHPLWILYILYIFKYILYTNPFHNELNLSYVKIYIIAIPNSILS